MKKNEKAQTPRLEWVWAQDPARMRYANSEHNGLKFEASSYRLPAGKGDRWQLRISCKLSWTWNETSRMLVVADRFKTFEEATEYAEQWLRLDAATISKKILEASHGSEKAV